MCLAVPGELVAWIDREPPFARANVAFAGIEREVSMLCLPEAVEGDFVLVHAGIAISRIDPIEAQQLLETLDELQIGDEPS